MSSRGNRRRDKPELKNGYSKIANETIEALCKYGLPCNEMKLLLYIVRQSYGWDKKISPSPISYNQFSRATNISRSNCVAYISKLIKKNIILRDVDGKNIRYGINKYYQTWKGWTGSLESYTTHDKGSLDTKTTGSLDSYTKGSLDSYTFDEVVPINIKESIKESIKEKNVDTPKKQSVKPTFSPSSIPYLLSQTLFNQILFNLPEFRYNNNGQREGTIQRWAADIDKMIRIDKRIACHIWNMILWVQDTETETGEFWAKNIMSGKKLRKHYDQLTANIKSELKRRERNKPQHEKLLEVGRKWKEKMISTDI